jgi:hypothetical protein
MIEMTIATITMLIVAVIAIFLILMAINIVLFLVLRSRIPQKPFSSSEHATKHAYARDDK